MLAISVAILMITSAFAVTIPAPTFCGCPPCGFTPGFWKHNINVYLVNTNGKYSAFKGGPQDGDKLTDQMMENLLAAINAEIPANYDFPTLLEYLEEPGWSTARTNTANWFNWAAGYGPY